MSDWNMSDWMLIAQGAGNDGGAIFAGGCFLVWIVVCLVGLVFWIWALISAIQNPALDSTMRLVWVLVIIFTGFIGAVLYLLLGDKISGSNRPG